MNDRKSLRGDRNQCPSCGQYFNSTHAFEKHRTGDHGADRRCLTDDQMIAKGMVIGGDGFWRGSAMPGSMIYKPNNVEIPFNVG